MSRSDSTTFEGEPLALSEVAGSGESIDGQVHDGQIRDASSSMPRRTSQGGGGGGPPSSMSGTGGGTSTQRPYAYSRSSSGFGSFLNYANSPTAERARPATPAYSATRSTVYDAPTVSEPSTLPASSSESEALPSIPVLSKLEIPQAQAVSLTGPTPESAKPRPKGRGTLELERVLGLWAAKTPTSSFPSLPPLSSIEPSSSPTTGSAPTQPLFAQSIVSSEPESFVASNSVTASTSAPPEGTASAETSYSSNNSTFPQFGSSRERSSGDSLAPPSFGPRRRRSKSDTDIMRADSLGFPHSNLPVGPYVDPPPIITDRPTFSSTIAPPTPVDGPNSMSQHFAMNPTETWRSPPPPSSSYTTNPIPAFDPTNANQHELASRSRSPLMNRNHRGAGGPGYQQAALLDVPGDGGRTRRSRSQGAGHRSSRSDDFSHLFPSMQQSVSQPVLTSTSGGLLAPPSQPQAPPPVPAPGSPLPPQAGSPYHPAHPLPPPSQAPSPYAASQNGSPYLAHSSPYPQPYSQQQPPPQPQSQGYPASQPYAQAPDQGYLANQAALLASAALIAFNPTDQAHAAAAAAGYLPPTYSQFPPHPYNSPYGSAYGAHPSPSGLPPLPSHHPSHSQQLGYPVPRPVNGLSHATRHSLATARDPSPGGGGGGAVPRPHPAYAYHSPLHQLPSPPPTGKVRSPAATAPVALPTRVSARGRRRTVLKAETEDDGDEDELMMRMDEDEVEDRKDGGDEGAEDEAEGEDELDGEEGEGEEESRSSPATSRGRGRKGTTRGRGKRQVSEEGFSEKSKTTQATIDAAKRRRNANAVAKFVCELCGETFTRRYNLRGHQRAHNGEKPYKCSYDGCDKAFARAHDCKRHELLHLGVRKYHCSPCKRDFVRLDALHRHHRSEVGQACVKQLEAEGYVFDEKGAAVEF